MVGGLALVLANCIVLEFGLEVGEIFEGLGGFRGPRRRRSGTAHLVQNSVFRFRIVDARVILRTMEELECARVLLVTEGRQFKISDIWQNSNSHPLAGRHDDGLMRGNVQLPIPSKKAKKVG
jgi:hypothetical protein